MITQERSTQTSARERRIVTMHRPGAAPYSLSNPELDVLSLVLQGQYENQIACTLGLSVDEVQARLGSIRSKMGARSTTEAGVKAIREHILV